MRLLIDTQSLIWYVDQDHLLSPAAHRGISDPANDLLLSAATVWEIGIKVGLNKLTLSMPYRAWMERAISDLGLSILPITVEATDRQAGLPWHHRDPFDRLIIAQALVENMAVVSSDQIFDQYGIKRLWCSA
ncbi:MAG: type II toxin-antitoxin system VapC family toxin [Methylococcaceae bacterium]|nr:type II toxin-antitoxin system VapC family toxin [Methylococcaceae bacterium]